MYSDSTGYSKDINNICTHIFKINNNNNNNMTECATAVEYRLSQLEI